MNDEGSIGAFNTMDELEAHATEAGYRVVYASSMTGKLVEP